MHEPGFPRPKYNVPAVAKRDPIEPPMASQHQVGSSHYPDSEFEESGVSIVHYLWILRRHRYRIIAFVAACVLGTYLVSSRLTPLYEATAKIEFDSHVPAR